MPLPTNEIKFSDLNREFNRGLSSSVNLNAADIKVLEGNPNDGISMSQLRGKSRAVQGTVSSPPVSGVNLLNYVFNPSKLSNYVPGNTNAVLTIPIGVYVYSDDTSKPALEVSGWTTGDTVTIINKGFIMGKGGQGGGYINPTGLVPAKVGGPAISILFNTTIDNTYSNAYIGGGGGGGAGAVTSGGGGAGGGAGGPSTVASGAGGAPGLKGTNGGKGGAGNAAYGGGAGGGGGGTTFATTNIGSTPRPAGGAGGGRIFPGDGGAGGGTTEGGFGSNGGSSNNPALTGAKIGTYPSCAGGGGGWGAKGGDMPPGYNNSTVTIIGAAGGKAVETNGNRITWVNADTSRVWGIVNGSASVSYTISSNQKEFNLYDYLSNNKWDRTSAVNITINADVYIWSDNTSVPALTTGGPYPNGLSITNNGYIIGKGGEGGCRTTTTDTINARGKPGGPALSISSNISLINNGYIAGGGGGGSGGGVGSGGGGGAGGGKGGGTFLNNITNPSASYDPTKGGAGGAPGAVGGQINGGVGSPASPPGVRGGGGGGGRILPGTGGTYQANAGQNLIGGTGGGSGGAAGSWYTSYGGNKSDAGGNGGSANNPGGTGSNLNGNGASGGGGGWGAAGGSGLAAGGEGGAAVITNGNVITWNSGDTTRVYGAVS